MPEFPPTYGQSISYSHRAHSNTRKPSCTYEITQVFGTTLKALIEEERGDGIMSAIDFELSVDRVRDPRGDRVRVTFNGKFPPYRRY